jgi:antitoxin HicB
MIVKIPLTATLPLTLEPQPEGGWTVTSPTLPEFLTEGDTIEEVLAHVQDCFATVVEMYEDMDSSLPEGMLFVDLEDRPVIVDTEVAEVS